MKISRKTIVSLLACIVIAALTAFGLNLATRAKITSAAETADVSHYFYNQLKTNEQKEFYKAMEQMNSNGTFKSSGDYDLVANGHVTQAQLEAYANGDNTLLTAMGAARDAFYTDYNEIFYVDFGYLSLRVTQGEDGKFRAYLGNGRADTYYVNGFDSKESVNKAIDRYNAALEAVLTDARKAVPTDAQIKAYGEELAKTVAQIQYAHAWIAEHTLYRLESDCTKGNEGHIRTPYGVFVAKYDGHNGNKFGDSDQGEALCEGYSRAFKAVMDKLGVPCVLINGVYRHAENQEELHMWAYVQLKVKNLDGEEKYEWYAVDQTFDDLNRRSGATGKLFFGFGDAYNEDYFLKGASLMNTQHATSPYKSEVEFPFTYPELAAHNLGSVVSYAHGGMIKVEQEPYDATLESSTIKVSVFVEDEGGDGVGEWCGYQKAAKKGYYIVVRYEGNYLPEQIMRSGGDLSDPKYENDTSLYNTLMTWAYVNPIPEVSGYIEEYDEYTLLKDTGKPYGFEFAVTKVPPRPYDYEHREEYTADQVEEMFRFMGDPTIFIARSGFIETKYAEYKDTYAPPYVVKSTPSIQGKLDINESYDITVEYDQYLKLKDGDTDIKMSVVGMRASGDFVKGKNAIVLEKVVDLSTLKWDRGEGDNQNYVRGGRVSFKFTPSKEYAHDNVMYYFSFNLVGENSGVQVNPVGYAAAYECAACCYRSLGYHWNVWGQPQLLENGDLSTEGWETSDGKDVTETKDRLALVVTAPNKKQESQMNDLLADELKTEEGDVADGGFQSYTYNISLAICKAVVLKTGQGVRVSIGFPDEFEYEDSMNGVTFKAYHFVKDEQNNVVDVEEIECTVTPLGLIILCKSFSPFAIVAVKGTAEESTDKTVIISNTMGGTAYSTIGGSNLNLFKVREGEKRTLTVKANEGYVIESIKVDDRVYVTESTEMKMDLNYDDLSAQSIVEVKFVAKTVKAAEAARGEESVVQHAKDAVVEQVKTVIKVDKIKISVKTGEDIKISPTVTAYGEGNSYQWYKDGEAISRQTFLTLVIKNAEESDSGKYTLKVVSASGSTIVTAESAEIEVTVKGDNSAVVGIVIVISVVVLIFVAVAVVTIVIIKRRQTDY